MSGHLAAMMNATLRVLIVEDDQRYRSMLATMLRDLGCESAPVGSAIEANQWLAAHRPDVILLDLNLPMLHGMDFLAELRQRDRDTPVIILTGVGTLPAAQSAIRHGVSDFLTKPCHLGAIEAALDRVRRQLAHTQRTLTERASLDDAGAEQRSPSLDMHSLGMKRLAQIERQAILAALQRHHGNRSAAAAELGISRRTLHYRLAEYRQEGLLPGERRTLD